MVQPFKVLDSQTEEPVNITLLEKDEDDEYTNPSRQVIYIPESSTVYKYTLKLQQQNQQSPPPPHLLDNVEFVMDVRILNGSIQNQNGHDGDDNDTDNQITKNIKAKFTSSRSGCDNTRGYGHIQDEGLEFSVFLPYSVFAVASRSNDRDEGYGNESYYYGVEVVAGWARGHEAVTLTHPIYFLPQVMKDKEVNDDNKEEDDDDYDGDEEKEEEEIAQEEEHGVEL